jgi:hypothetical protein
MIKLFPSTGCDDANLFDQLTFCLRCVEIAEAYDSLTHKYEEDAQVLSFLHLMPEAAYTDKIGEHHYEAFEHLTDGDTRLSNPPLT